jgi:NTP pyrophosphatase (non-canonical NTP hydrolase)
MNRPQVTGTEFDISKRIIEEYKQKAISKHGLSALVSTHESLGALLEEFDELRKAVRKNDSENIIEELAQISALAEFAIASIFSMRNNTICPTKKP